MRRNRAVLVRLTGTKSEVLVDPNRFDREVMLIGFSLSPNGRYLSYGLSIAGSDQLEWRILDLEKGSELQERLTDIQFSEVLWDESNDTVYYVKNCFEVYAHKIGTPLSEGQLLYRPEEDLFVYRPRIACNGRYILVEERRQVAKQVGIRLIDLRDRSAIELIEPGEFDITPTASSCEIVTEQVWYTSKDGTRVPMFLTHRKEVPLDGNGPVLLYGYGGFGNPVTPFFRSYQLRWVEEGGIFAVPNIRGGKEFGTNWYDNGKLDRKQNVFDDFIAAAEWLRSKKPGPIGIFGTSNGGLLIGAALTQRPALFDAAVVNKGVLDMLRFHLFTIGRFWICDYGNPEDPNDYAVLLSYSPYHNVKKGVKYPPTLVNTADHDDRVVPIHSFKFFAALKEANSSENPILLRIEESCGHGGSDSREQEVAFGRDLLGFFYAELLRKEAILSETLSSIE
ncbi:MAG: S9 family peptidase [Chlamydiales bacterium]|nr:S9 family peptidase [Chlamydiales bacterium]